MSTHEEHEHDKVLGSVLKEYGVVQPSEKFSTQLTDRVVSAYGNESNRKAIGYRTRTEVPARMVASPWVARVVMGLALVWGALFLYFFGSFVVRPVISISILSFTVGLWILILLIKRNPVST